MMIIMQDDNLYRIEVIRMPALTTLHAHRHWNIREGATDDVAPELENDHSQVLAFVVHGEDDETTKKKFAMLKQVAGLMHDLIDERQIQKWDALVDVLTPDLQLSTNRIIEAKMMSAVRTAVLETEDFVTASAIAEAAHYSTKNPSSQPNRWKRARQIFAVSHKGVDLYPLYALDREQEFRPLPVVAEVLGLFADKKSGWETAFWFASVNSHLKNKKPKDLLRSHPKSVLMAARGEATGYRMAKGGSHHPPAGRLEATLINWGKGQTLHRVHRSTYKVDQFNPSRSGDARFSPLVTSGSRVIATLYAGTTLDCALMETFFQESIRPSARPGTFD
jgi:hypothetical protein